MADALEHAEICAPRTNGIAVLVSHNPRDLVQMSQVVNSPTRHVLRQRNQSEGGMASTALEVFRPQIQGTELVQTFRASAGKFIQ